MTEQCPPGLSQPRGASLHNRGIHIYTPSSTPLDTSAPALSSCQTNGYPSQRNYPGPQLLLSSPLNIIGQQADTAPTMAQGLRNRQGPNNSTTSTSSSRRRTRTSRRNPSEDENAAMLQA
ncbi:hypothetical protein PCASD_25563 [Puccinia coronata f. sp. avenae]|uniref:Uncharacterized protein n=1 Tax=Puccinia coronata f. sp. avenae TaxID=200324 RepID=A0A2N5S2B0_9BASI|nr:hypothetical protein PCASD_25563 [Puccinia coronata f. sp. avenae]